MYNRIISYLKKNVLPKLESLPTDVAGVKEAFNSWKVDWTQARAARLDNLDAKVSTRASVQDVTNVSGKVDGVGAKVDGMGTTITALDAKVDKVGIDAAKAASYDPYVFKSDEVEIPGGLFATPTNRNNEFVAREYFTRIVLPNCEVVGANAFINGSLLREIDAPKIKKIGAGAFESTAITEINFKMCESVGNGAFMFCKYVNNINLPALKLVSDSAFAYIGEKATAPLKVTLPSVTTLDEYSFQHANISELVLPNFTKTIGINGCFRGIGRLAENSYQNQTRIMEKLVLEKIEYTTNLWLGYLYCKVFDFGNLTSINSNTFGIVDNDCYANANIRNCADALILRSASKVCVLAPNAFRLSSSSSYDCPPKNIYVPDNLVASYKTASNWSQYADRIKPLSQYVEV